MADDNLKCNYPKCRSILTGEVKVTSCSHIFCIHHELQEGFDQKCPACNTPLVGNMDIVSNNIAPSEEIKSSLLLGLPPEVIFHVMSRGLQFWNFQQQTQIMHLKAVIDYYRKHLAQRDSTLESFQLKIKHYMQIQEQKVQDLTNEVETLNQTVKDLQSQLNDKNRQFCILQSRYDGLRRQSVASLITRDTDNMDVEMEHSNRLLINRERVPTANTFVFCPNGQRATPRNTPRLTPRQTPMAGTPFRYQPNIHRILS